MPAVAVPPVPSAYATVTRLPLAGLRLTVNVRFAEPLFPSVTLGESIDSVGAPSSSVIVSVTDDGCVIPCELVAEPDTVTLLSASSRVLSTAVTVTVPLLLVAPAAMVSVALLLSLKSPFAVFAPAAAETVTVVCWLDARSRLAVTVAELVAPLSAIELRDSARVTVGVASSSVIVSVTDEGCVIPCELVAEPDTVTLLSASSVELSTAVTVTEPVLLVLPAAMVSVVLLLSEKSPAAVFAPGAADTVMVVDADEGRSRLAVTVAELVAPLSAIDVRDSASVTVGAASSSLIVPVPVPAVADTVAFVGLLRVTTTVSFGSSVVSPRTDTVTVLLVSPAENVSVPPLSAV